MALDPTGKWELYDMEADRTEMNDVAARHPEQVRSLVRQWEQWARRTNVIPWMWNPRYSSSEEQ